jgi:hypothetical protein
MEKFINTGRFICKDSFLDKNPNEKLHRKCTDIVHYEGGAYIQVLKTGEFYLDESFRSHSLDEVEVKLWEKIIK